MAGSEDDDSYQQKIDPALRHCQYHTSRALPYAEADTPSTSTSTSDRRINLNNHNKGTSQPIAHDLLHPVHPARPTLQPKLRRSTSYTVSSHSSSSASSPESHSPKFLPATFSTGSIAEISPPHRLTKPTHSSSFQDFQSSIKSTRSHPFTNGHHQNLRIPPPFSPGEQTALTTTSQESIGRNPTTINRQEFGEQWLINQRNPPSEEDAKPNDKISAELDYSLQRLINLDVFRQVLEDPTSRHTFREAIIEGLSFDSAPPNLSLTKLDLWNDCRGMNQILNLLKIGTSGLSDIYLHHAHSQTSLDQVLPELNGGGGTGIQDRLLRSLTRFNLLLDAEENEDRISHYDEVEEKDVEFGGLKAIENKLLISLYQNEFPLFLKKTLVSNVVVKLGKFNLNEQDRNGLGDCFCLTNPRMRDHPIVLVSEGFTQVTGYERRAIVGKNCRFLQGPGTSPESVQRIRDGLNSGEGCTELLLNYRKDGTPFYCLLCIIPLRDVTGALIYFIGGQINVTGMLSSKKSLSFLMTNIKVQARGASGQDSTRSIGRGTETGADDILSQVGLNQHSFSPTMQQHASRGQPAYSELGHSRTLRNIAEGGEDPGRPTEHHAAGSIILDGKFAPNLGKETSSSRNKPFGFFRRLAALHHRDPNLNSSSPYQSTSLTSPSKNSNQTLIGAEALFHQPKPLSDHFNQFEVTYSHLIVFDRDSRRVIFATTQVIELFGLPSSNSKEIYKSKLIQTDFSDLVWSMTPTVKESVANLRSHLKKTIKAGLPISLECQVKPIGKSFFFHKTKDDDTSQLVTTKIHLTPLLDHDGRPDAYVCLFG